MHGSSSVPQEWLKIINEYGGEIGETYGVPVEEIVEGIKYGVRKVNIDTDLRLASTGAIREFMAKNPSEFDPRKYGQDRRRHARHLHRPLRRLRHRRQCQQDQADLAGRHVPALRQRRAGSEDQLIDRT